MLILETSWIEDIGKWHSTQHTQTDIQADMLLGSSANPHTEGGKAEDLKFEEVNLSNTSLRLPQSTK